LSDDDREDSLQANPRYKVDGGRGGSFELKPGRLSAMTTALRLIFEQYLEWDDGTEKGYELVDVRLTESSPKSKPNTSLADFLVL
jgi:hypothetical protein